MNRPLQFEKVILEKDWPKRFLGRSKPGTVLVYPGPWGTQGGLLRLTASCWITLKPDQIFAQQPIPWPDNTSPIESLRLVGTRVELKKKGD